MVEAHGILKGEIMLICLIVILLDVTTASKGMLYPRDSESRTSQLVSGMWDFRADFSPGRNDGFIQKWYLKNLAATGPVILMPVPSSYNDITQSAALRDFVGWVWYEKEIFVSPLWKQQRVVLRFDSAHYYTSVWLNGEEVMSHAGGHLPFEAEINDVIKFGSANRITVAVNNTLTHHTLPPGQIQYESDRNRYPAGYFRQYYQFDFFNYAGIHRDVKLYTTPSCYIDDVTIITKYTGNTGYVTYNISRDGKCSSVIGWTVEILDINSTVVSRGQSDSGILTVKSVKLWWPVYMHKQPGYQYTMKITLKSADGSVDVYRQLFGIRTIKQTNKQIYINNKQFYCQGFGKHEDSDIRGKGLDYAVIAKDFNLIAWVGANCFRTSHYPYAEEIMDLADSQGVMVIDESPAVGLAWKEVFNPTLLAHHRDVMMELVRRDKNRPAVYIWSVANEPRSDMKEARDYFKSVIEYTRSLDRSRLVTFVTGPTDFNTDKAAEFCDVICVNHYFGWYSDTGDISIIRRQSTYHIVNWHKKFNRPVIVTEYGADTITGLHQSPSFVFTEEFQVDFIREYHKEFDELRKDFLVGEMIWNFADFMTKQGVTRVVGNRKGIFTRQRQPKMAAHVIRARYLALARNTTTTTPLDDVILPVMADTSFETVQWTQIEV